MIHAQAQTKRTESYSEQFAAVLHKAFTASLSHAAFSSQAVKGGLKKPSCCAIVRSVAMSSSSGNAMVWGKESWLQRSARLEADRKVASDEWTALNKRFSWKSFFLQKVMAIYKVWNLSS